MRAFLLIKGVIPVTNSSIGIELEGTDHEEFTEAQYKAFN